MYEPQISHSITFSEVPVICTQNSPPGQRYFHNLKDAVPQCQLAKYAKTLIIPNYSKILYFPAHKTPHDFFIGNLKKK